MVANSYKQKVLKPMVMKTLQDIKTIGILGGLGFVGSHLCDYYLTQGYIVYCLDNQSNGDISNVRKLIPNKNFKLIIGDIRNKEDLSKVIPYCKYLFLLAAQIHVDKSLVDPELTCDVNIKGTLNVLELAKFHNTERIIFASSSEVYGSAIYTPMDEKHPTNPPHLYGATKVGAEAICRAFQHTYDMPIFIARCFNLFGPRQKDS